jgi:hypothetical protein
MTSTLIDNIEPLAKPDSELVNVALLLEKWAVFLDWQTCSRKRHTHRR